MAFGSFDSKNSITAPMAEINMVPLIDVMMVLLVIFIVTAPLLSHSVRVNLPKASAQTSQFAENKIEFSIQQNGQLLWNGENISRDMAKKRFNEAALHTPQPEIHILADKKADYQFIAETLADASRAGLSKFGFVSMPEE